MVPTEIMQIERGLVAKFEIGARHLENRARLGSRAGRIDDNQGPAAPRSKHCGHSIGPGIQQTDVLTIAAAPAPWSGGFEFPHPTTTIISIPRGDADPPPVSPATNRRTSRDRRECSVRANRTIRGVRANRCNYRKPWSSRRPQPDDE